MNEVAHQSFHKNAEQFQRVWSNLLPQLAARRDHRVSETERLTCSNALLLLQDPTNYNELDALSRPRRTRGTYRK